MEISVATVASARTNKLFNALGLHILSLISLIKQIANLMVHNQNDDNSLQANDGCCTDCQSVVERTSFTVAHVLKM
jgi:hypothetical protein